ncbi:hypothetical protein HMPREF0574_1250 [Mobiluncus curtisii subsp. curtisii ATCC 35241]|nr:hypothetical protein HMPREF0574_1250 [Mobiluncus curtisii subsp. curtisii ATCC 35241]
MVRSSSAAHDSPVYPRDSLNFKSKPQAGAKSVTTPQIYEL